MSSTTGSETYATWLSRSLDERGLTTRSLSRLWRPDDPETARRMIRRYLKGDVVPTARTRLELARVIGSTQTGPDEDAEGDLLVR